jgi:polyisoprenoid-binding protein YceI
VSRATFPFRSRCARTPGGNSVAEGEFKVKRLDFRIGEGMWADTSTVADEVAIRIRMVLPPVQ